MSNSLVSDRNGVDLLWWSCFELNLTFDLFADRIRPACLPTKASILDDRASEIYRLVREDAFDTLRAAVYTPKNYTQMETEFCELIYRVHLLPQTAFCAQGDVKFGNQGDPFVVKVKGPNRTSPVYVIGLDAIRLDRLNPGIYLNLYPYVEWINEIINGKMPLPEEVPGNRISMEFDSSKNKNEFPS